MAGKSRAQLYTEKLAEAAALKPAPATIGNYTLQVGADGSLDIRAPSDEIRARFDAPDVAKLIAYLAGNF